MRLLTNALQELVARASWASDNGFGFALAEDYIATLAKEAGSADVPGVAPMSAAHVAALGKFVLDIRAGKAEAVKPKPKKAPEKPVAPVKAPEPPKVEVKEEPKAEPEVKEEPKAEVKVEEPKTAEVEAKVPVAAEKPAKKASETKKGN